MDLAPQTEGDRGSGGLTGFLLEAVVGLRRREVLVPALILLVLLTFSNVVILQNIPARGSSPSLPFIVAAILRVGGLLLIAVALARIMTNSPRSRWTPDGGFWLYAATFLVAVVVNGLIGRVIGDRTDVLTLTVTNIVVMLALSPLIVWFVATAVAEPLAWHPSPWLRDLRRWWFPAVFWTLLLVTPMAVAHASIDMRLIEGAGDRFWPLALFDGALSTAMALLGIAINTAAYRRVAERGGSRLSAEA
jgi:hypothetical protein